MAATKAWAIETDTISIILAGARWQRGYLRVTISKTIAQFVISLLSTDVYSQTENLHLSAAVVRRPGSRRRPLTSKLSRGGENVIRPNREIVPTCADYRAGLDPFSSGCCIRIPNTCDRLAGGTMTRDVLTRGGA